MKIIINPQYEYLREWLCELPDTFSESGTVLYQARNEVRRIVAPQGLAVCAKRYRQPALPNRIIYTFFRKSKAERAYNNAFLLLSKDIPTPEPIAYIEERKGGLLSTSYLVTVFCPYTHNFYEFRQHSVGGYENVVTALALLAADMHEQGILHKDFSPGNILFEHRNEKVNLTVVDINRMQFGSKAVSLKEGCQNFARLWGDDDFFTLLAKHYAQAREADEDECIRLTIKYRDIFWRNRQ